MSCGQVNDTRNAVKGTKGIIKIKKELTRMDERSNDNTLSLVQSVYSVMDNGDLTNPVYVVTSIIKGQFYIFFNTKP